MKDALRKLIVREGRKLLDNIDAGNSELTEDEAMEMMSIVAHKAVGKGKAQEIMNMQKSNFDNYVRIGLIPKGRKRSSSFKELAWYEDELRQCKKQLNR